MNTCLAKPLFKRVFPESMLAMVVDYFDVVEPIHDFQPSCVEGVVASSRNWNFTDRINIIIGSSGSGKSRVIEAMKQPLTELAPATFRAVAPKNMSIGQKIFTALETLLQVQPPDTCLMIDDAMGMLDREHLHRWCDRLKQHDKQVVIATGEIAWQWSAAFFNSMPVKLFRLELPPKK